MVNREFVLSIYFCVVGQESASKTSPSAICEPLATISKTTTMTRLITFLACFLLMTTLSIGLLFMVSGFIYDIAVINITHQDPTLQILNQQISSQKTLYGLYYTGIILTITGLARLIRNKLKARGPGVA